MTIQFHIKIVGAHTDPTEEQIDGALDAIFERYGTDLGAFVRDLKYMLKVGNRKKIETVTSNPCVN